eukprot:gene23089-29915_t
MKILRKEFLSDDAMAGAFAGAVARLISAPFDVLKIRFQMQYIPVEGLSHTNAKYSSIFQALRLIVKEEGWFALWKGNLSATYLWISYAIVQFSVYGFLKRLCENLMTNKELNDGGVASVQYDKNSSPSAKKMVLLFLAGAGAGIAATERVHKSMYSFLHSTLSTKGPTGLFAGVGPAVIGVGPYMGLNFALFETFKFLVDAVTANVYIHMWDFNNRNSKRDGSEKMALPSVVRNGLSGGLAGGVSKFVVYPLDTVKKRMQAQALRSTVSALTTAPTTYNGFLHCIGSIYCSEGLKGFYRGIVPTTVKSVVATAITFAAYEAGKDFLRESRSRASSIISERNSDNGN